MNKKTRSVVGSHGNGDNNQANVPAYHWKDKHSVNLRKRGIVRFQIGLLLSMLLVYGALELSFRNIEPPEMIDTEPLIERMLINPAALIIEVPKAKQPIKRQPITASPAFEIVKDDTAVESLKEFENKPVATPDDQHLAMATLNFEENKEEEVIDVILGVVEEVPIFPGCEKEAKEDRLACFNKRMRRHIVRNFRYPKAAQEMGAEGKVNVFFKIDVDGRIANFQMRGTSPAFEKEAQRIIRKLPRMKPGRHNGKPARVGFSIPINFQLDQ